MSIRLPIRIVASTLLCYAALTTSAAFAASRSDLVADNKAIGLRSGYADCITVQAVTTHDMLECASKESAYQDDRLNSVYKRLMKKLEGADRITLRNEERAWIATKEKRCKLPDDPGTTDQVSSADCEVDQTARRAYELERRERG